MKAAVFAAGFRERLLSFEGLFLLIFLATIALRFYSLDVKLFHHDEAIHAWFSYRLLTEGTYTYDPMYHGPFLYYVTAGIFSLLGDSDLVGRLFPALLGTLLVPLVYPIYRLGYLDKKQTLVAALFLAVSPNMVYFSRFLRNDVFIVFFTMVLLVALLYYFERHKVQYALIAGAAIGFGMTAKENMPIIVLIFGAYLLYLVWTRKVRLPKRWIRDLALGALVAVGIMAILYSSFGAHPEVLMDGWLRAIEHWTSMHQAQRLGGPPYFYILLFLLYEVPILILAVVGVLQFVDIPGIVSRWRERRINHAENPGGTEGAETEEEAPPEAAAQPIEHTQGFKDRLREILSGTGELRPIDRQKEFARFAIFWMILSLGVYAYIGEKVPWLILHQLLPMIFVAVYMMTTKKAVVAVVAGIFLVAMTFHVAYTPADINEPIVQVQNSEDLREVFAKIDAADKVAVATDSYWPLPWYYRGDSASKLAYYSQKVSEPTIYGGDFDVVITHDADTYPTLDGYVKETYRLNYWFSYEENKDRLPEYYFLRDGKVGSRNLEVFSRVPATA
ncbi:flippase activity-associated protein Agl23 [Methanoculleus sp. MH98A]|uniref:flippase activity-associated protein Agl23 n=1 Tax=Methanoculleus sp. MH98A TaxID=1495314 RepID=UPI0004A0D560|nr:flippase activity-associated protein Agl23 [Methanoculleus sp. MH98A]KDE56461.1 glycosyl transferase [Methanoculleus sp. MH98A]